MTTSPAILTLKKYFTPEDWPWALIALQQEPPVWSALTAPVAPDHPEVPNLAARAIETLSSDPRCWTPTALGFLELGVPGLPEISAGDQLPEMDADLLRRAQAAWEDHRSAKGHVSPPLESCMLLALALYERVRQGEAWKSLLEDLDPGAPETATILACLAGLVPEPEALLAALFNPPAENAALRTDLGLRVFLSRPRPEAEQQTALASVVNILPLPARLAALSDLAARRPGLAAKLAEDCLAVGCEESATGGGDEPASGKDPLHAGATPGDPSAFDRIAAVLRQAHAFRLAARPDRSVTLLAEALRALRRQRGHLSAALAQSLELAQAAGDANWRDAAQETSLEAWKQAVQLAPDTPRYAAGLIGALIAGDRLEEAQACLGHQAGEIDTDPALALAAARLADARDEPVEAARRRAQALRLLQGSNGGQTGGVLSEVQFCELAEGFRNAGKHADLVAAAQAGLKVYPSSASLWMLAAPALLDSKRSQEALLAANNALALLPAGSAAQLSMLESVFVSALEASSAWEDALDLRLARLEGVDDPTLEDLHSLRVCAANASRHDALEAACQGILEIDPEDVDALKGLAEVARAGGDLPGAVEHISQSVRLAPDRPDLWLSLVEIHRQAGQDTQAFEALRAACQALPNYADVHAMLGDAYVGQNQPTQALACFRRAAGLSRSVEILMRLGRTLLLVGRLDEAVETLGPVLDAAPENARSPELVHLYARALLNLNRGEQAIPLLVEVTRKDPSRVEPVVDLARAFMLHPVQPSGARRALPFLKRILGINPDDTLGGYAGCLDQVPELRAEVRVLLAEAYAAVGDSTQAMQAYRAALDDPLNSQPAVQTRLSAGLGMAALKLDQPELALAALKDAAQSGPLDPALQRSLSEAYLASGLSRDAFEAASAALNLQPEDPENLRWFIGQAERLASRTDAAQLDLWPHMERALETAVRLEPHRADLFARLGAMRAESGDRSGALEVYRRLAIGEHAADLPYGSALAAARSMRELGDAALAARLLEAVLQRKVDEPASESAEDSSEAPINSNILTPVQAVGLDEQPDTEGPAALYAELSLARQQSADLTGALDAAEKALDLEPNNPNSHSRQADLLYALNRLDPALDSLRRAVELAPDDVMLRQRAAGWMRQRGRPAEALKMAERGLEVLDGLPASEQTAGIRRSLSLLAAAVSLATLRPRRAQAYLQAVLPEDDPSGQEYAYAALRAEIALDLGEADLAQPAIEVMLRKEPGQPRTDAAMARLARRRGDDSERDRRCRSALRSLLRQQMEQTPILPPSTREELIASFLSVAQAAIENRLWDEAQTVLNRLIEIIPETPLAYFKLAQVSVLRGESQCLLQDLEVTRHAEGPAVLSDEACQSAETNFARAQSMLEAKFNLDASADFEKWNDECLLTLGAWMARARALFRPDPMAARVYESLLRAASPGPEDVAVLMMSYRRCGEQSLALGASQAAWKPSFDGRDPGKHPLILLQMALAHPDPAQSLANASKALESALALGSQWPPAPCLEFLIARLAYRQQSFTVALQAIQQALATWPDEPRWQKLAARLCMVSSQAEGLPDTMKALLHYEQAIAHDPDDMENHLQVGKIYLSGGQVDRAVPALEHAVRLNSNHLEAWLVLAQAQAAAGDMEAAAASADHAIDATGAAENPETLRQQALLLRGRLALQTGNPRGALSRAQTLLRDHVDHPEALYLLSHALEALNRPAEALQALEKALPMSSNPLPMQIERAQLVRRSQGLEAGISALQELIDNRAAQGDPGSETFASAASEPQPPAPELLALLASWLNESGRVEAAIQTARTALIDPGGDLSPERRADMNLLIGSQMRRAGQLDQAILRLSEAINYAPNNLEAYLELGRAYQDRREYRQALKIYQRAISVAGDDHRPYYHAGLVLKDSKDYIAAEAMLRRAAQIAPDEVSVHRLLGAVVALNLVHNRKITPAEA